jgi:glutamine amidotransferase
MCQLLGICSNKKVDAKLSLREFRHRGKNNPHGWGFGFYDEKKNKWVVIKEPESLYDEDIKSEKFNFKSKIIIEHVRLASCGSISHKNTHPFTKENYIFAHIMVRCVK